MTEYFDPVSHTPLRAITDFGAASPGTFFVQGESDTETGEPRDKLTGGPGSWVASTLTDQPGRIDWHGANETLSYAGPHSRYFFQLSKSGTSYIRLEDPLGLFIYRKGVEWVNFLSPTLPSTRYCAGAAVMESGGVSYLNVATYNGSLYNSTSSFTYISIWQRTFQETYENHDMYNADTNPDGWVLIGAYSLPAGNNTPVGPMFFSQDGAQCQGIFGTGNVTGPKIDIQDRIVFDINVGTADMSAVSAGGDAVSVTSDITNYGVSATVIGGSYTPGEGFCFTEAEVVNQDGEDYLYHHIEYTYTTESAISTSIIINEPCICAVDYKSNSAVFLEIRPYNVNSNNWSATMSMVEWRDDRPGAEPVPETYMFDGSGTTVSGNGVELVGPDRALAIDTIQNSSTNTESGSGVGSPSKEGVTAQGPFFKTRRQLLGCDLRVNLYIYTESVSAAYSDGGITTHRHVIDNNGSITVLSTSTETTSEFGDLTSTAWGFDIACSNTSVDNSYSISYDLQYKLYSTVLHDEHNTGGDIVSFAVDSSGALVASGKLWTYTTGFSPVYYGSAFTRELKLQDGYFNHLTGGDLISITGLTGDNPRYPLIGLLDWDGSYSL